MSTVISKSSASKIVAKKEDIKDVLNKVSRKPKSGSYARFDTRLPIETKEIIERAAAIKGFKSVSEFVIHFSSEAALSIIERHNRVLASDRDQAIFFDALLNPPAPDKTLVEAAKRYKAQTEAK